MKQRRHLAARLVLSVCYFWTDRKQKTKRFMNKTSAYRFGGVGLDAEMIAEFYRRAISADVY